MRHPERGECHPRAVLRSVLSLLPSRRARFTTGWRWSSTSPIGEKKSVSTTAFVTTAAGAKCDSSTTRALVPVTGSPASTLFAKPTGRTANIVIKMAMVAVLISFSVLVANAAARNTNAAASSSPRTPSASRPNSSSARSSSTSASAPRDRFQRRAAPHRCHAVRHGGPRQARHGRTSDQDPSSRRRSHLKTV